MTLTIRRTYSQQTALQAVLEAYEQMLTRLLDSGDERLARVGQRSYDRGMAVFDHLRQRVSEEQLHEGDHALLDWYLSSRDSGDLEQVRMWLGLLPPAVERILTTEVVEEADVVEAALLQAPDAQWPRWFTLPDRNRRAPTAV